MPQDLRTGWQVSGNNWLLQELAQVRRPLLLVGLIDRLGRVASKLAQRHPGRIAAGEVVALGLGFAAPTLLGVGELLEATMKRLHLPANLNGVDDYFPRHMRGQVIDDHPFNAAVWGNQLE